MSDAIERTYLDLSKRRQQQQKQEMNISNPIEADAVPKTPMIDESQQQPLTTQSTFSDITDLVTIKDNTKTKSNRKVSTTTNDTTRNILNIIYNQFNIYFNSKVSNYLLMYQHLLIYKFHFIVVIILLI
jgi:hypothetical protein